MFDINPIIRALIEKKKKKHTQKYFDMDLIMWTAPALSLLFQNENNLEMCLFDRKGTELLPLNTFLADKIMTHIFQMQERNPEGLWVNRISNMRSTSGTGFSMRVHACMRACVWKWFVVHHWKTTTAWRHHKKQLSIIASLCICLRKIGY